jgi:hypothetical protein
MSLAGREKHVAPTGLSHLNSIIASITWRASGAQPPRSTLTDAEAGRLHAQAHRSPSYLPGIISSRIPLKYSVSGMVGRTG